MKNKICVLLTSLPFIVTLICMPFLPNTIAFHFSFNMVDQYANKFCLLIIPFLILVLGLFNLKECVHRTNYSMISPIVPLLWVGIVQFFILLYEFFPDSINVFFIFRLYISLSLFVLSVYVLKNERSNKLLSIIMILISASLFVFAFTSMYVVATLLPLFSGVIFILILNIQKSK